MAGRPAAARSGGLSGALIGLIAFAFISVAALGGFIFMLTRVQEAEQRADSIERRLEKYGTPSGPIGNYYENEASARNTTVFNVALDDLRQLAKLVAGTTDTVGAALVEQANRLIGDLAARREQINQGDTLLTVIQKLDAQVAQLASRNETLDDQVAELEASVQSLSQQKQTLREEFEQQVAQLRSQLEQARGQFDEAISDKDAQVAQLQRMLESNQQELNEMRREAETQQRETQVVLQRQKSQISDLQKKIQGDKAAFDPEAILKKADGRILRAVPGSEIVYINLGEEDNIRVPMSFEVFSQAGIETSALRGKASIEVVTVMENSAECRVTRRTPGQPIIEGDPVVNISYEENRRPKFVVRGQFDLNFDGEPDFNGAEHIEYLIRQWGGQVQETLDETVDYVVVGVAPQVPQLPPDASPIARDLEERRMLERAGFDELKAEARSMYIPVITQNQFLFLTGYSGGTNLQRRS